MIKYINFLSAFTFLLSTSLFTSCISTPSAPVNRGQMMGGVIGATAGSLIADKDKRLEGALIGGILGGLIGNEATNRQRQRYPYQQNPNYQRRSPYYHGSK